LIELFSWIDWSAVWPALVEIGLLYLVLYGILRFLQGTRGAGVLRGLLFFVIMAIIMSLFFLRQGGFDRLNTLIPVLTTILIPLVVLFQPEIRRFLLRLGEAPIMRLLLRTEAPIVIGVVDAVFVMSKRKIGGLIVIEREVGLGEYVERGTPMSAKVTSELLVTIFWPGSPLHDGAAVIRGNRVAAAGCLLPLTDQPDVARTLGTRHRAGIGITEHSDALSIIVSEESQDVSLAYRGKLRAHLDKDQLRRVLEETLIENVSGGQAEIAE